MVSIVIEGIQAAIGITNRTVWRSALIRDSTVSRGDLTKSREEWII